MPDQHEGAILSAVERCLFRDGLKKTTINSVAKESGVSRSTIYRAFANREALIAEMLVRHLRSAAMTRVAKVLDGVSFDEAILMGTIYSLQWLQDDPIINLFTQGEGSEWFQRQFLDVDSALHQQLFSTAEDIWIDTFLKAKADGVIPEGLCITTAIEWLTYNNFMMLVRGGDDHRDSARAIKGFILPSLKHAAVEHL